MVMYDAEAENFGSLLTAGGLQVDPVLHPFIIIRVEAVAEHKCPRLRGCIRQLTSERAAAQVKLEAEVAVYEAEGVGLSDGGLGDGGNMDIIPFGWDDIDSSPGVQVMVLFDEDPKDPDYVDESSELGMSEEERGVSEEEEEAVESEVEVKRKIVIDLTTLSDSSSDSSSVCSQAL